MDASAGGATSGRAWPRNSSEGSILPVTTKSDQTAGQPAIARLREATRELHERLDGRLDAVAQLRDPARRGALVERYAALHRPAEDRLEPFLADVPDLDFAARSAARRPPAPEAAATDFPAPRSRSEALGMLYVLEGSLLGGRFILREVAAAGGPVESLAFLDPYGREGGGRWRSFLGVLERQLAEDEQIAEACEGARRAFRHAERVLCGSAA